MAQGKTKEYQKRAAYKYNEAHDKIQFFIDKGEKKRWAAVGLDSNALRELIREEYNRRIGATDITPQQEPIQEPESPVEDKTQEKPQQTMASFMPEPTNNNFFG